MWYYFNPTLSHSMCVISLPYALESAMYFAWCFKWYKWNKMALDFARPKDLRNLTPLKWGWYYVGIRWVTYSRRIPPLRGSSQSSDPSNPRLRGGQRKQGLPIWCMCHTGLLQLLPEGPPPWSINHSRNKCPRILCLVVLGHFYML